MRLPSRQAGISIWSLLTGALLIIFAAVVGFRVMPAYVEYFSVKSALQQAMAETTDFNSAMPLRSSFQRKADAGYITTVRGSDIQLEKFDGKAVAHLDWTRKLPLIANVYLVIEFETKAQN